VFVRGAKIAKKVFATSLTLLALVVGLWATLPSVTPSLAQPLTRFENMTTDLQGGHAVSARVLAAKAAGRNFLKHALLGLGIGGFASLGGLEYPHNIILEVLTELGLVGFALCAWLALLTLRNTLRLLKESGDVHFTDASWILGVLLFTFGAAQFSGNLSDSRILFLTMGIAAAGAFSALRHVDRTAPAERLGHG
jgi:O-antigen ligase